MCKGEAIYLSLLLTVQWLNRYSLKIKIYWQLTRDSKHFHTKHLISLSVTFLFGLHILDSAGFNLCYRQNKWNSYAFVLVLILFPYPPVSIPRNLLFLLIIKSQPSLYHISWCKQEFGSMYFQIIHLFTEYLPSP